MCVEVLQLYLRIKGKELCLWGRIIRPHQGRIIRPSLCPSRRKPQKGGEGRSFGRIFRSRRIIRPSGGRIIRLPAHRQGACPREGAEFLPDFPAWPDNPPQEGAGLSAPPIFPLSSSSASAREGADFPP